MEKNFSNHSDHYSALSIGGKAVKSFIDDDVVIIVGFGEMVMLIILVI